MHVLFLHHNFPAQFGQIATMLARDYGYRCTFVSEKQSQGTPFIQHLQYTPGGGAAEATHYCSRTFENQTWRSHAVYELLKSTPSIQPDLIVGHSGFVSPMFLRDLYQDVPQIGYFEYFYHASNSDMDFRHDLPSAPRLDFLRARNRNAQLLLDLHNCDAGYSPTEFQRAQLPSEYHPKIQTIFDGIDTDFWSRDHEKVATLSLPEIPPDHKLLTYVSRGFEAIRGFDIFLQAAERICKERSDVSVVVVGEDRVAYGGDNRFTGEKTFKEWTVDRYRLDLDRIHFVGRLPASQLVTLLSRSDLHIYLTAPFVLSWSLINAMSCGCTILASDTAPIREAIQDETNGVLADFFSVDDFVRKGLALLADPDRSRDLGNAARQAAVQRYSHEVCLPKMLQLYHDVAG